jgi:hypothetical protein
MKTAINGDVALTRSKVEEKTAKDPSPPHQIIRKKERHIQERNFAIDIDQFTREDNDRSEDHYGDKRCIVQRPVVCTGFSLIACLFCKYVSLRDEICSYGAVCAEK